ncbi:DUF5709 domain-containing protein [Solwaraspora sp. WMMD406]|uniref:DUF5709 domain-containing protein n=1 Tax=Solwaraspora sp. WMMD406 TaxID=3016095 RepID=UPI0024160DE7|nr:DUF5709 domain-containing protein [Solwaraspora sp. WMMD406]MDG4767648.1 DUF5709 domain-containing protein [Solwaraspora sp. WMMD406]
MREDDFPRPVSDTESEGIPETADDDSTAYDDVASGREADGPDPASVPGDVPMAVDHFGNTAQEQRDGESLDYKVARESLETPVRDLLSGPADPALGDEADSERAAAQAQLDADVIDPGPSSDPDSPVSVYDHGRLGGSADGMVGRLVEPDEGAHSDAEPDAVAADAGAAGGGASAEELAIHETQPPPDRPVDRQR